MAEAGNPLAPSEGEEPVMVSGIKHHPPGAGGPARRVDASGNEIFDTASQLDGPRLAKPEPAKPAPKAKKKAPAKKAGAKAKKAKG